MQGGGLKYLAGPVGQNHFFQSKYLKNGRNVLKYGRYFVYSIILFLGQTARSSVFPGRAGCRKDKEIVNEAD